MFPEALPLCQWSFHLESASTITKQNFLSNINLFDQNFSSLVFIFSFVQLSLTSFYSISAVIEKITKNNII